MWWDILDVLWTNPVAFRFEGQVHLGYDTGYIDLDHVKLT